MNKLNTKQWLSLFFLNFILFQSTLLKADVNSFGHRIFIMQEKQAQKGNTLAEYKLGTFYEFGISVKPDTEKAKIWYEKAAKKKYNPATDRLLYLDIKQHGYKKSSHANWLSNISRKAKNGRANALILFGQMHHHGLGVKKDLNKAIELLSKASSLGHTEVDREIGEIKQKIASKNKAVEKPAEKKQPEVAKKVVKKKTKAVKAAPKKARIKKSAKNKEREAALKRQKYEETMRKLRQEALILEQQQEWTEKNEE
ncbi:MAG: sel1 repeat family protein [Gammaproteobacteria bacterium]|nr:sel1 repeat family protein [Gammaproteobacteria bacterium]